MNNLQDHVTSIELSQRLKEAGFKQDSIFYWVKDTSVLKHFQKYEIIFSPAIDYKESGSSYLSDITSAYTASQLLKYLPSQIKMADSSALYDLHITTCGSCYEAFYRTDYYGCLFGMEHENLAEVAAQMILHLIENGLMEVPQ